MGTVKKYMWEMDDPYVLLAHHIVAYYRPADVLRVLTESAYIKNCIIKEVRELDLGGHYVDCIIENILEDKDRMKFMHELDSLSEFFFSRLDKERLRSNIRAALKEAGIELDGYSTGGSVESAKQTSVPTRNRTSL